MNNKRNTLQKKIVFDAFAEMHNHPSAGMVYEKINEEYPGISKATVYRLLSEAADEGKILRLKLVDSSDRYDITMKKHYHIVCKQCGAVAVVEVSFDDADLAERAEGCEGFSVEGCHLEFTGLCRSCYEMKTKEKN